MLWKDAVKHDIILDSSGALESLGYVQIRDLR
jgi:hypothetical protein